jgi:hypothetical protein
MFWLSVARNEVDAEAMVEVQVHCETCHECRKEFDFFRRIAGSAELGALEPPESWTSEAAAQFQSMVPTQGSAVIGELVFDSILHESAVRSRRMESRRLVFDLPGFEIDLILEYSGPQLDMVMGHLLAKDQERVANASRFALELQVDTRIDSTTPNELGEFIFKVGTHTSGKPLELRCRFEEGPCAVMLIPC